MVAVTRPYHVNSPCRGVSYFISGAPLSALRTEGPEDDPRAASKRVYVNQRTGPLFLRQSKPHTATYGASITCTQVRRVIANISAKYRRYPFAYSGIRSIRCTGEGEGGGGIVAGEGDANIFKSATHQSD